MSVAPVIMKSKNPRILILLLALAGNVAIAGWPDRYLQYSGTPDLSKLEDFREEISERPFFIVGNRTGAELQVYKAEGGFLVSAKIAEYIDLDGYSRNLNMTSGEMRLGWSNAGSGNKMTLVGAPLLELFSLADSAGLETSRDTYLDVHRKNGTVYKCFNILNIECLDIGDVVSFANVYFKSPEANRLWINWFSSQKELYSGGNPWTRREPVGPLKERAKSVDR